MLDQNTLAALAQLGIGPEVVEEMMSGLLWITVVTVATAIPTWILAKRKGRSVVWWTIFALSIPLLPLLLVWLLPKLPAKPTE